MKLYFAGSNYIKRYFPESEALDFPIYLLESILYMNEWQKDWLTRNPDRFILDSGVFTFLNQNREIVDDVDNYVDQYIQFINSHNIQLFFEMDFDRFYGLKKVEEVRARLEDETGKKPILVYHEGRGANYFIEMCKNYPYVAIGSPILKDHTWGKTVAHFPWFINIAHKYGAKIHLLGCGSPSILTKLSFDSADTTSWIPTKYGIIWKFNGYTLKVTRNNQTDFKIKVQESARHNFFEWMKFAQYLEGRSS